MPKKKPIKSITIIGRRWFRKSYGNTYSSAEILVNGNPVAKVGPTYGYGNHYIDIAFEWLEENGILHPPRERYITSGGLEPAWRWAERTGVKLSTSVSDVARERDL